MHNLFERRLFLQGIAAAAFGVCGLEISAIAKVAKPIAGLKPGTYRWQPERSPEGPVAIVVSLPDQLVHVYRNGIRIGLSTCSTGKPGHLTPTGVFTILQKDKHHHSSTYNNAPMPNMNRLTWSGVALHAGHLPGYPASHGCIRLPLKFSELLFGVTHIGTPVIVANDHSEPGDVAHPGTILSALAEDEMDVAVARLALKKLPPRERHADMQHTISVLVSRADRELYIIRDGKIVTKGKVDIERPDEPLGSHVFALTGAHDTTQSLRWKSIGYQPSTSKVGLIASDTSVISRVQSEPPLASQVAKLMHPGLLLILTDAPAHPDTRSDRDFVIVTQDTTWKTSVERAQ